VKRFFKVATIAVLLCLLLQAGSLAQEASSPYLASDEQGNTVHISPTPSMAMTIPPPAGALSYHGGPIMPSVKLFVIFWVPPTLQNNNPTSLSTKYQNVVKRFATDYPGHGIANNSTQYYSINAGVNTYFKNAGSLGGTFVDTNPYPASGCTDPITPGDCITDAQLQTEIQNLMALNGWSSGLGKMYLVFTSTGEGSCMGAYCAYRDYCAYHGYFGSAASPVIYGNMPYADPNYCFATGTQQAPSGDKPSDGAANLASHEITEATTDPELNAWWDTANGEEIGDLCAWTFGSQSWDGGLANQMWNGHFYDLQLEYDNHTSSCVQAGP
jgi:hypothetical protein